LNPEKQKTLTLDIAPESLAFWDIDMKHTVEPGEFEIMVGSSSRTGDLRSIVLTVTK
jgi:beta-glucosidase